MSRTVNGRQSLRALFLLLFASSHLLGKCRSFCVGNGVGDRRSRTSVAAGLGRLSYSTNPFQDESSGDRDRRMELVRDLRKTFYANETGLCPPQHGVYTNMPIYRDDWTELPGLQHTFTVSDADYVNLLMKVVSSPKPHYYGHILLEGGDDRRHMIGPGSEAPVVGTLMQVSDFNHLDNGDLFVVVQALGRFIVGDVVRNGYPYPIATVELLPDIELVDAYYGEAKDAANTFDFVLNDKVRGAACAGAVAEASEWRDYEFKAVDADDVPADADDLPPVSSLNEGSAADSRDSGNSDSAHAAIEEYLSQSPTEMYLGECSLSDDFSDPPKPQKDVFYMEHNVWLELDNMAKILTKLNPKGNTEMPIPNQILGLLPPEDSDRPWPKDFKIGTYMRKMSHVYSVLGKRKNMNVDDGQLEQLKVVKGYPPLRRARRLSYIVWALIGSVMKDSYIDTGVTRQQILEMDHISERLEAAATRLREINEILTDVIKRGAHF